MESHLRIDAFADTVDVRIGTIILYTEWYETIKWNEL